MKKLYFAAICFVCFLLVIVCQLFGFGKSITIYGDEKLKTREYVEPLVNKLNENGIFKGKNVQFYMANFLDNDNIILPDKNDDVSIIWVGGRMGLDDSILKRYDFVFASTHSLTNFLKRNEINAKYLPFIDFDDSIVKKDKSQRFWGIIGEHSVIVDILNKKNIKYKKYSLDNIKEIEKDLPYLDVVFANTSNFYGKNLDLHPIFYKLIRNKIAIASKWWWPNHERLKIFNDAISFYALPKDAEILVEELLNNDKVIEDRKEEAFKIVSRYYSVDTNLNRMMNAFHNKKDYKVPVIKNSVNIDIVISVGHITGGDFWLAKDLLEYFDDNKFSSKSITYFDSIDKYNSDFNIVVMGVLPVAREDYIGNTNVLYIAYPSFEGNDGIEKIKEIDDYVNDIKEKCNEGKGIDVVVTASKGFNEELNKRGIKSYYIPQFTNTKKFYPDYHKELKSDVFFVGVNTNYRRAWKYLKEDGIDVTIYGSNYPEGISNGYYLDNRILRKYYSSAKIVLNDSREGMLKYGFIGNRIFDATACGALVISDYMKEIEDVYGDSVVMWKTKEELIEKVKYYLDPKNEAERLEKANRAREITLKNFTAEMAAKKFQKVFDEVKK